MEKTEITTYTAIGADFTKDKDDYHNVLMSIVSAARGLDQAQRLIERCEKEGKHLIFYYPPSEIDTAGWELVGEIEDGMLYVG